VERIMKGNKKLIDKLNALLSDELTAINQYMVHAEMAENWGYKGLAKSVEMRAITEMKHAEKLIARILFLEGIPVVSHYGKIHIGAEIPKQVQNDLNAEYSAVKGYNEGIQIAMEVHDNATKDILQSILDDEDSHVDELEEKTDQIAQLGIQNFLLTQVKE
jgi:bacterioferritin